MIHGPQHSARSNTNPRLDLLNWANVKSAIRKAFELSYQVYLTMGNLVWSNQFVR